MESVVILLNANIDFEMNLLEMWRQIPEHLAGNVRKTLDASVWRVDTTAVMESFGFMISGPQGDFQSPKAVWVTNELVYFPPNSCDRRYGIYSLESLSLWSSVDEKSNVPCSLEVWISLSDLGQPLWLWGYEWSPVSYSHRLRQRIFLVSTASLNLECRPTGSELEEKETKAIFFPIHTQVQESIWFPTIFFKVKNVN